MNSSTKILIASFIILACSIGFFAGSIFMNPGFACKRHCPMMANGPENCPRMAGHGPMNCPRMGHGPHMMDGKPMPPPPPQGMQPGEFKHHKGPHHKGPHHKGPHGHDFHKNMENHAEMDSIMQMTPEQKEALKANRAATDSTFKVIGKQKMEADKAFREALESGDANKINAAKAQLLAAEEAMLNQRAASFSELAKILTPEQREKFRNFRKAKFQK